MVIDMKAALLGNAVRAYLAGRGAKTPVAYLYNGVRLPKLPEWDKETYPYACIWVDIDGITWLHISSINSYHADNYGISGIHYESDDYSSYYIERYKLENGSWQYSYNVETSTPKAYTGSHLWANTDILNEDGSVYLEGNDPVPIYE